MEEIEVKILEIDKDAVIKKLESLGADAVFDGELANDFYDFGDGKLSMEQRYLRLRNKGEVSLLTFKSKVSKDKAKIMKEYEISFRDNSAAKKILESLGLKKMKTAKKHRTSFKIGSVRFDIDTVPGIPTYMEVEAPTLEEVKKWVEKLGFSWSDAKPWSGVDLARHYNKGD